MTSNASKQARLGLYRVLALSALCFWGLLGGAALAGVNRILGAAVIVASIAAWVYVTRYAGELGEKTANRVSDRGE